MDFRRISERPWIEGNGNNPDPNLWDSYYQLSGKGIVVDDPIYGKVAHVFYRGNPYIGAKGGVFYFGRAKMLLDVSEHQTGRNAIRELSPLISPTTDDTDPAHAPFALLLNASWSQSGNTITFTSDVAHRLVTGDNYPVNFLTTSGTMPNDKSLTITVVNSTTVTATTGSTQTANGRCLIVRGKFGNSCRVVIGTTMHTMLISDDPQGKHMLYYTSPAPYDVFTYVGECHFSTDPTGAMNVNAGAFFVYNNRFYLINSGGGHLPNKAQSRALQSAPVSGPLVWTDHGVIWDPTPTEGHIDSYQLDVCNGFIYNGYVHVTTSVMGRLPTETTDIANGQVRNDYPEGHVMHRALLNITNFPVSGPAPAAAWEKYSRPLIIRGPDEGAHWQVAVFTEGNAQLYAPAGGKMVGVYENWSFTGFENIDTVPMNNLRLVPYKYFASGASSGCLKVCITENRLAIDNWGLVPVPDGPYIIKNLSNNLYLTTDSTGNAVVSDIPMTWTVSRDRWFMRLASGSQILTVQNPGITGWTVNHVGIKASLAAPIALPKLWTSTYTKLGNQITVNKTAHGLSAGPEYYFEWGSGFTIASSKTSMTDSTGRFGLNTDLNILDANSFKFSDASMSILAASGSIDYFEGLIPNVGMPTLTIYNATQQWHLSIDKVQPGNTGQQTIGEIMCRQSSLSLDISAAGHNVVQNVGIGQSTAKWVFIPVAPIVRS